MSTYSTIKQKTRAEFACLLNVQGVTKCSQCGAYSLLVYTILCIIITTTTAASQAFSLTLTDMSEVEGLPQSALAQLAQSAVAAGETSATEDNGPWRVTLDMPSYLPVMQHAKSSVSGSSSA
jgi:hypothetical protein